MFLGFVEGHAKIGGVLVVLGYAKVALGYCKGTVVVNVHDYNRGSSGFPGGVAKGLTEAVTAYIKGNTSGTARFGYYTVGLHTGYGLVG